MINRTIVLVCLLLMSLPIFGQTDQITIIGKGKRNIEPAYRILEFPTIVDSVKTTSVPDYPLLVFQVPTSIQLDTIERAKVESSKERLKQLFPFYGKFGIGTALMPLGEVYFNSVRNVNYNYGIHAQHLSAFKTSISKNNQPYLNANFDNTNALAFLNINEYSYKFNGVLKYDNDGFNYYGARKDIDTTILQADSLNKQRFQNLGSDLSFDWIKGDSAALNFKLTSSYNYFFSKPQIVDSVNRWNNREHYASFNLRGWYKHEYEVFYSDLGMTFNGYRQGFSNLIGTPFDTSFKTNNTIVYLSPGVRTQMFDNKLKVEIGTKLAFDFYEKTRVFLYPKVEVKYSMFNNIFIPYIGINGDLKQNRISQFSRLNPFLNSAQDSLLNDNNLFSFHGGIKGVLSKELTFNFKADYSRHLGYGLFIQDSNRANSFSVSYDTMSVMKIEGSINYTKREKLNIEGIARFNSYQTNKNAYAWNLPQLEFLLRGQYNLYNKLFAQIDADMQFGRKTLVLDSIYSEGIEDGQYYANLKPMIDMNLKAEYRYNPKISVFLEFNNLISVRYNRYYNYPVQGFQLMGGFTCRF